MWGTWFTSKDENNESLFKEEDSSIKEKYNKLLFELQKDALIKGEFKYDGREIIFNRIELGKIFFYGSTKRDRHTHGVRIKGIDYYVIRTLVDPNEYIDGFVYTLFRNDYILNKNKENMINKEREKKELLEKYKSLLKYKNERNR